MNVTKCDNPACNNSKITDSVGVGWIECKPGSNRLVTGTGRADEKERDYCGVRCEAAHTALIVKLMDETDAKIRKQIEDEERASVSQ